MSDKPTTPLLTTPIRELGSLVRSQILVEDKPAPAPPPLPGLGAVSAVANMGVVVDGLCGIVCHALDASADRLINSDEGIRLVDERTDRDLIWSVASLVEVLGDTAPAMLSLWIVNHAALVEAVRLSVEAIVGTEGEEPAQAHMREQPASIDGEALVEALMPLLDASRHTEGPDGSILVEMKPWELEAIDAAISPALAVVAPEPVAEEPRHRFVAVRWSLPGIPGGSVEIYDRENAGDVEAWDKNAAIGYPQQVIASASSRQACETLAKDASVKRTVAKEAGHGDV